MLAAAREADPLLLFAFRLLLARLMLGFGKLKFGGAHATRDRLYIRPFLHYQPLPSKPGFFAATVLPDWAMRLLLAGMFVSEILAPPLLFVPGWPRLLAALLTLQLMVGIGCVVLLAKCAAAARPARSRAPFGYCCFCYCCA